MAPLIEAIVGLLLWLRRAGAIVFAAWIALVLWLALRRAGRKGFEVALILVVTALTLFTLAVFAPRPPMSEAVAVALALLAAALVVATVGVLLWLGIRGRRSPPPLVKHTHPPWENDGW